MSEEMTGEEIAAARARQGVPTRMRVAHPDYGSVEVEAYCRIDALVQAAQAWNTELGAVAHAASLYVKRRAM